MNILILLVCLAIFIVIVLVAAFGKRKETVSPSTELIHKKSIFLSTDEASRLASDITKAVNIGNTTHAVQNVNFYLTNEVINFRIKPDRIIIGE